MCHRIIDKAVFQTLCDIKAHTELSENDFKKVLSAFICLKIKLKEAGVKVTQPDTSYLFLKNENKI